MAYAALRASAGAFTPGSAPPYYHFAFAPELVLRNALEYVDRGATIGAVLVVLTAAALRVAPRVADNRRLFAAGAVWFAAGYAITVFLPVRSSLYAVFPAVGAAIASAAVVDRMIAAAAVPRRVLSLAAVIAVAVLAAIPTYRARNGRYVEPARLSERALRTIAAQAAGARPGATIVSTTRPTRCRTSSVPSAPSRAMP